MRILVVGAGATGGYYGARLLQAGRDVSFLVRPKRAQQLREHGLQVLGPHGDVRLEPPLLTADALGAHRFDLVLVTVKAYSLAAAIEDFAPAVGPGTLIVPVLNGMRHLDLLAERFGAPAVLGGVSYLAATLDDAGRVRQLKPYHRLRYGARRSASAPTPERLAALHATLSEAGFDATLSGHIEQDMWEKWIFLAALGGITCLLRGSVGEIASVPCGADLALVLLDECTAVAAANGHVPSARFVLETQALLTEQGSDLVSSMYRDLIRGLEVESDQILGDLLARARAVPLATPLLAAAYAHLDVHGRGMSRNKG